MAPKRRTKKAPAKKAASRKAARGAVARPKKKSTAKSRAPTAKTASSRRAKTKKAPQKASAKKPASRKAKSPAPRVARRDRAGHFDPRYKAELRAKSLEGRDESTDEAFVRGANSRDDLAEELGEETVATMTTGEDEHKESLEQAVDEELGGPFVETSSASEFAGGKDASNPADATREPFPKT